MNTRSQAAKMSDSPSKRFKQKDPDLAKELDREIQRVRQVIAKGLDKDTPGARAVKNLEALEKNGGLAFLARVAKDLELD